MQCLVCSEQGAKGFTGVISSFSEPFSSQTDLPEGIGERLILVAVFPPI